MYDAIKKLLKDGFSDYMNGIQKTKNIMDIYP